MDNPETVTETITVTGIESGESVQRGNQRFESEIDVNALNLTRAVPGPLDDDGNVMTDSQWNFQTVFTIGDQTRNVDSGTRYTFAIPEVSVELESDSTGDIDWNSINNRAVTVRSIQDGLSHNSDSVPGDNLDGSEITEDAIQTAVEGETVNLFDINTWEFDRESDEAEDLREIRESISEQDIVELFIHEENIQAELEMGQVEYDEEEEIERGNLFFNLLQITEDETEIQNGEFDQIGIELQTEGDADNIEVTVIGAGGGSQSNTLPPGEVPNEGENAVFQAFDDFRGPERLSNIDSSEVTIQIELSNDDDEGEGECLQIENYSVTDYQNGFLPTTENGDWSPC